MCVYIYVCVKKCLCEKGKDHVLSCRLIISVGRIKSWFSSENGRRKALALKTAQKAASAVIDKALAEDCATVDLREDNAPDIRVGGEAADEEE